jgi:hypothetical protein
MAARKVNKSAWIRSQPIETPAKELVAAAKKAGIKITDAQVYTARSSMKKAGGAPKGKPGPKPKAQTIADSGRGAGNGSLEQTIRAIVRSEIKKFFSER